MRVKSHHEPIRGGPCRRPDESEKRCRSTVSHTSQATCRPTALVKWSRIHPLASIWSLAAASMPLRDNPSRSRRPFGSAARSRWAAQYARQRCWASRCNARRSRNAASHCRSNRRHSTGSLTLSSRGITDTGPLYVKFGAFDLPRRRGITSPLITVVVSVGAAAMAIMKPAPSDIHPPR
jgi:hypothetical protein